VFFNPDNNDDSPPVDPLSKPTDRRIFQTDRAQRAAVVATVIGFALWLLPASSAMGAGLS